MKSLEATLFRENQDAKESFYGLLNELAFLQVLIVK